MQKKVILFSYRSDIYHHFLYEYNKKPLFSGLCTSREIRTLVLTLKGLRPGPLDDGGSICIIDITFQ